ncbi:MAG: hypothetical protein V6Z81_03645 [Parvularculales bacterium]
MVVSIIAHLSLNYRHLLNYVRARLVAAFGGVLVTLLVLVYGVAVNNEVPHGNARG